MAGQRGWTDGLDRLHRRLHSHPVLGVLTKVVVTIVGGFVVAVGALLSLPGVPGPGVVVAFFGLALLSTEWTWARQVLERLRRWWHAAQVRALTADPVVRRRRLVLLVGIGSVAAVVVVGGLWRWGWPAVATDAWDQVQGLHPVVPELPFM